VRPEPRAPGEDRRLRALSRILVVTMVLSFIACSDTREAAKPVPQGGAPRAQLAIGYSLLYQEADGIPKLKWLLLFKEKSGEMGQLTNELLDYYRHLAEIMQKLAKEYPGMRIDAVTMSGIEADERKAIGSDMAKDFAPLVGKSGIAFEREALLMFYNSLNEQRHLVGVMLQQESDPGLRRFLETTKAQLDARYGRVSALLNHRYFVQ
jgi:hypothetical protein